VSGRSADLAACAFYELERQRFSIVVEIEAGERGDRCK
jgi:hypothetical protein